MSTPSIYLYITLIIYLLAKINANGSRNDFILYKIQYYSFIKLSVIVNPKAISYRISETLVRTLQTILPFIQAEYFILRDHTKKMCNKNFLFSRRKF